MRSRLAIQIAVYKSGRDRFSGLVGGSPLAVVELGRDGRILDCNATAAALSDLSVAHLIGQPIAHALSVEQSPTFATFLDSLARGAAVDPCRAALVRKSGERIDVLIAADPPGAEGTRHLYIVERGTWRTPAGTAPADMPIKTALDAVPAMISYWDERHRCQYANRPFLQWFKRSAEELPLLDPERLMGPELYAENEPYLRSAFHGERQSIVRTITPAAGEARHVWTQYIPDEQPGGVRGVYIVTTDFTELVRVAELKREADTRLKLATEASDTGIWDLNLKTGSVFFSDVWKRQIGFTDPEFDNHLDNWTGRLHPDDKAATLASLDASRRPPYPPFEQEYRLRSKDGSYRWILSKASVVKDADGTASQLIGSHQDITERKAAAAVLAQAQMRFRAVIEATPVPYALIDENQLITYVNPEFTRTFGYTVEDIPTRAAWWTKAYPDPEYRHWVVTTWSERFSQAMKTGRRFFPMEVTIQCKDGSQRTAINFVGDLAGDYRGEHLGIMIDVSEERFLERSLMEATMREQHRIGMNLHDGLGQELTGLSMMISALSNRIARVSIPEIKAELDRLAEIARRALDSTRRVAHGLGPIESGVGGLFRAIESLATAMQSATGHQISVRSSDDGSADNAEQTALESLFRIVQESITNSVKHGRGTRVDVQVHVSGSVLDLTITDNGEGFDSNDSNAGFGINSMRFRVRALGGQLDIGSTPAGGTRVHCRCPITPPATAEVA